ncbi:Protein SRG1 [Acorus calamus]|uniref:Protein SRG1 n=1 Tax=Acorus calamus TaxID=4465 RepID=A0AAV9DXY2_ACOCL|nr:Protein SRG1 [Acorus calamus]
MDHYIQPPCRRPNLNVERANLPIIDMKLLNHSNPSRELVIDNLGEACRRMGCFHVVNHGIRGGVMKGALDAALDFFKQAEEDTMGLMSDNVRMPVRFGESFKSGSEDKVRSWRLFLKHYAHPLDHWVRLWPFKPPHYREKMGSYAVEARSLALKLLPPILESLGLGPSYLKPKIEDGMQVMAVNCYPPCPRPDLVLGIPPHTDYGFLTVLLQGSHGLHVMDPSTGIWTAASSSSLLIHVGDHLELLSNGMYRSVVHRATVNAEEGRVSIASVHGLGMEEKVMVAEELVGEGNPRRYRDSSFGDFLDFLESGDCGEGGGYKDTLRIG